MRLRIDLLCKEIIDDAPIDWDISRKDWPADTMRTVHLTSANGGEEYVLITDDMTQDTITKSLLRAKDRLKKGVGYDGL